MICFSPGEKNDLNYKLKDMAKYNRKHNRLIADPHKYLPAVSI